MILFFDIDNTICYSSGLEYENAMPRPERIAVVNRLYDAGHEITYWTSRGYGTGIDHRELTVAQLKAWGCKYHAVRFDKPLFDRFYDDRAFNAEVLDALHNDGG